MFKFNWQSRHLQRWVGDYNWRSEWARCSTWNMERRVAHYEQKLQQAFLANDVKQLGAIADSYSPTSMWNVALMLPQDAEAVAALRLLAAARVPITRGPCSAQDRTRLLAAGVGGVQEDTVATTGKGALPGPPTPQWLVIVGVEQ